MFEIGVIYDISKDLYYVKTETGRYMSKARGVFRKHKFSPMVGDNVKIEIFEDSTAYIGDVYKRQVLVWIIEICLKKFVEIKFL